MYYPDQRSVSPLTIIRREVMLPDTAVGSVRIREGQRVDIRDVVANGVTPSPHIILDAMTFFGLKKSQQLDHLLFVEPGDTVDDRQALAGKSAKRGKRLFSPVRGIITAIDHGRIIIQVMPELIDLEAGVRGKIAQVEQGRGVIVEAVGALIQGVWGNNKRTIAGILLEPEGGLDTIVGDSLDMRYSGAVVVTRSPLTHDGLDMMRHHNFAGLIAPSMDSSLREDAINTNGVIILTEGFGAVRMNLVAFNLLARFEGRQATIDAQNPNRWETRYPEIIVNATGKEEERPSRPNVMLSLRTGMNVRISREPYTGSTGRVVDLPKAPILLDNGLRVPCALVELVAGETVTVPLANIETLGR
jgi:hypothetical protein